MAFLRRRSVPPPPPGADEGDQADDANELSATPVEVDGEADSELELAPSRMRGTEALYGYVVGLELLVVGVLNTTITTGTGAPVHPNTTLDIVGIAASIAFFGVIQTKSRTIVGFAAIVAAFFVTLPKVPDSLAVPHILALAFPLAYGLIITQRQRRAITKATRAGRRGRNAAGPASPGPGRGAAAGAGRRDGRGSGGRRRAAPAPTPTGPTASRRYTPPKTKRGKGQVRGR